MPKYQNDWATWPPNQTSTTGVREILSKGRRISKYPSVGIFWFDIDQKELFGVESTLACDLEFTKYSLFDELARTCDCSFQEAWSRRYYECKDSRFQETFIMYPRGQVFEFIDSGFVVFTGPWINKHAEVKNLILYEFDLPYCTEFRVDYRWK